MRLPKVVTIEDVKKASEICEILRRTGRTISQDSLIERGEYGAIRYLLALGLVTQTIERPTYRYLLKIK